MSSEIEIIVLNGAFGMRNVSPFCLKLELLMKQLDIPHTYTEQNDPRKAPKGKFPYAIIDGVTYADSEVITEKLDEVTQGAVYAGLTPAQKAHGLAMTRLAEEHLYWFIVGSRWLDDAWWPNVVDGFFQIAPALVRPLVASGARRGVRQTLQLQGIGRHNHAEQEAFARRDLQALQDGIPDSGFLGGDEPRIHDFAVAGIMAGLLDNKPPTWLTPIGQEYTALVEYTDRVQAHMGIFGRHV